MRRAFGGRLPDWGPGSSLSEELSESRCRALAVRFLVRLGLGMVRQGGGKA